MARQEEKNKAKGLSASVASPAMGAILPLGVGFGIAAHSIYSTRNKVLGDIFGRTKNSSVSEVRDLLNNIKSGAIKANDLDLGKKIQNLNNIPWYQSTDSVLKKGAPVMPTVTKGMRKQHVLTALEHASQAFDDGVRNTLIRNVQNFSNSNPDLSDKELIKFISSQPALNSSSILGRRAGTRFVQNVKAVKSSIRSNEPLRSIPKFTAPSFINLEAHELEALHPALLDQIKRAQGLLKTELTPEISRMTRKGRPGSALRINFRGGHLGNNILPFEVPEMIPGTGIVMSGSELQTQNIVGHFATMDKNGSIKGLHKSEEWLMMRFNAEIIPQVKKMKSMDNKTLSNLTKSFSNDALKKSRTFDDERRKSYRHAPALESNEALNPYKALISDSNQRIRFVKSETGEFLNREEGELVPKNFGKYKELYGMEFEATSGGSAAKGAFRVLSQNTAISGIKIPKARRSNFWGTEYATSRKPHQRYKPYNPTSRAGKLIEKDTITQRFKFLQGDMFDGDTRGIGAMTFYQGAPDRALEEGMVPISNSRKAMYEIERLRQPSILLKDAGHIIDQFEHHPTKPGLMIPKSGVHHYVPKGTMLGYYEGTAVLTSNRSRILQAEVFEDRMRISVAETIKQEQFPKIYGTKGIGTFREQVAIDAVVKQHGGSAGVPIHALSHASLLKKNRVLHLEQMLGAVDQFDRRLRPKAHLKNYAQVLGDMTRRNYEKHGFEHTVKSLVEHAKKGQLNSDQMAKSFGSLFHTHPEQLADFGLTNETIGLIKASGGAAIGPAFHFPGDPASYSGVDGTKMGSIEPRIYNILEAGHFGELGPKMSADLQKRSIGSSMEAVESGKELTRTLTSLSPHLDQSGVGTTNRVEKLSKMSKTVLDPHDPNFIFNTGGQIDFEGLGGLGRVHIPHGDTMKQLAEFRTNKDQMIQSDMTHEITNFLEQAHNIKTTGVGDFESLHNEFAEMMVGHHADLISGKHGIASNKVIGSRKLKIVTNNASKNMRVNGISPDIFEGMISDMETHANKTLSGEALEQELVGLTSMRKRGMAGELIPVMGFRHPGIGPHSLALGFVKIDSTLKDPVVNVPNYYADAVMKDGSIKKLVRSTLPGQAGDTDGDTLELMLASPHMEEKMRAMLHPDSDYSKEYESFLYKRQIMKVRSADANIAESTAAGAMKLSATENYVGQLSTHVTRAKEALHQYRGKISSDQYLNALGALEDIEQNPIAGKWQTNEGAAQLPETVKDIIRSFEERSTSREMPGVFASMFNPDVLEKLSKDEEFTVDGRNIVSKGRDLPEAFKTIDSALTSFGSVEDVGSGARNYAASRGKLRGGGVNGIGEYFRSRENSALSSFAEDIGDSAGISHGLMSAARTIGTHVMENKKAYMIAGAASLAVAAVLSTTKGALNAPIQHARMNNGTGDNVTPENITPNGRVNGSPSAPSQAPSPAPIRSNAPGMTAQVRVRGRMNGSGDPTMLSKSVRGALGSGTNVNTNVSDDRSSLTAQKLQDTMNR